MNSARSIVARVAAVLTLVGVASLTFAATTEDDGGWAPLERVTPGDTPGAPPSDAVVLFDGSDFSQWGGGAGWRIEDGAAIVGKQPLWTKRRFGDCQVHVEWSAPVEIEHEGARRGNSGVHLMGLYELQIMDAFQNETAPHRTAGALYKQAPPAVIAVRPPGEWNAYDILWTAPRFTDSGEVGSPAAITVLLNGVVVLNHVEVQGKTSHLEAPAYKPHEARRPFSLQSHGATPVRYRNIWARDFQPARRETDAPAGHAPD